MDSLEPVAEILGGTLKKTSLNTIPFTPEMRTLAYIMLSKLYPVTNLTTLFRLRTLFLYDLFTCKEINICGHIYFLLTKSITKRNSRTIFPFLTLIMAFIAKTRLKTPSGLTILQKDYPISAQTMTQSKAHITRPKTGISQIPKDNVEDEGGTRRKKLRGIHQPRGLYSAIVLLSTSTGTRSS